MTNILLLTGAFSPCPHSASQRVTSFARAFSAKGFDVSVVTSSRCLKKRSGALLKNVQVYDFNCPRVFFSISAIIVNPFLLLLYLSMSMIIGIRKRVDVVLASVPNGETAIAGFLLSKIFRSLLVIDVRDIYPPPTVELPFHALHTPEKLDAVLIGLFQLLYKLSDKVICVDANIKDELIASGVSPQNAFIIPNGADVHLYRPIDSEKQRIIRLEKGLPLEGFIFVYAGALTPWYPLDGAIEGASRVFSRRKDFHLLIIGHTRHAPYEKLASELDLENCVRFLGPLPEDETAEILSACDAGLVVYHGEDYWKTMYGSKIFSYMSCGLPILAAGPPGSVIEDIILKHDAGLFVGKPTADSFEKGFSCFLNDIRKIQGMGKNARKAAEKFYDREKLGLGLASSIESWVTQEIR